MTVSQTDFRAAVLDPVRPVPEGLVDPEGRAAGKRFDVYRNNVVVSLSNALGEAFPVIRKLLGENNFRILAGHFVRAHPPVSPLIALYGEALPGFLEQFEPVRSLGYLPDVARLELALRRAYHAADTLSLPPAELQALPPDALAEARFRLAPALQLVESDWPIVSIWRFNMEDGPKPRPVPETALITRPQFDPEIAALTPAAGTFVSAIAAGGSLGEALSCASEIDAGFDLTPTLGALISGGALIAIEED
ncbi:DNA-binding domain-containing protein [Tropicimonas sediminicola]|uniref:Putative DNA-binding domain-containing protein n=1 Tax=Tropicimonas sediminicola TaxID=1031541 RepID=A0A239FLP5_9RHOB|nr:DNA-binding domain-containing protein [Tropicimonas sediminicola]SNS57152.1 Putative DNA-binding domain-containing protein [Tropicimonas sediminicola]